VVHVSNTLRQRNLKAAFHSENAENLFRPHYAGEIENATITGQLDLCLRKPQQGEHPDYSDVIVFEKLRFKEVKPAFSKNSVFVFPCRQRLFSWCSLTGEKRAYSI